MPVFAEESATLLSTAQLELQVHSSLVLSGLGVLALPSAAPKPFRYSISGDRLSRPATVCIYAWNITHGGHSRASDEFRIQLTGTMPAQVTGESTIILGWSESFGVFVGWDPNAHDARRSASPSLQVREAVMSDAAQLGVASATRASGDVVVAFRPELLASYCLSVGYAHSGGDVGPGVSTGEPPDSPAVTTQRPMLERRLEVAYREWDFSSRVKQAYGYQCAICGLGLGLLEGAHIVPVAWPGSTDETSNGLALCRNHHAAYDRGLLSVRPDYGIEVAASMIDAIPVFTPVDVAWAQDLDGSSLTVLPADQAERPDPAYLQIGREARRWGSTSGN